MFPPGFQIFRKSYIIMRPKGAENFDFLGQKWRKYVMEKCWKNTEKYTTFWKYTTLPAGRPDCPEISDAEHRQ